MAVQNQNSLYSSLPLGTVVKIKNIEGLLMIAKKIDNGKFNYRCIAFPEGFYYSKLYKDISIDNIEAVCFMGYRNIY